MRNRNRCVLLFSVALRFSTNPIFFLLCVFRNALKRWAENHLRRIMERVKENEWFLLLLESLKEQQVRALSGNELKCFAELTAWRALNALDSHSSRI